MSSENTIDRWQASHARCSRGLQCRLEVSNQKRLESLKLRLKEIENQKSMVQQALASVDKQIKNKKIVFNSDDEEEQPVSATSSLKPTRIEEDDFTSGDEEKDVKSQPVKKSQTLFDSESSSEDQGSSSENEDDRFRIRPEFEGTAGKKLLQLQSRFSNDTRFKMDARFVESDSDDTEGKDQHIVDVPSPNENDEKTHAMEILRSVVGSGALLQKRKEHKTTFKDINSLHYDPTKEEHQKFEIKEEKKTKSPKKRAKTRDQPVVEETHGTSLPEVSSERFFEVSAPLKDVFGKEARDEEEDEEEEESKTASKGFSLLSLFGGEGQEESYTQDKMDVEELTSAKAPGLFPWQESLGYGDSSDEDDDQNKTDGQNQQSSEEPVEDVFKAKQETFFFTENDSRIQEGVEFFHCTDDADTIRQKWQEQRPFLVDAYRLRRKRAIRQNRMAQRSVFSKRGRKR